MIGVSEYSTAYLTNEGKQLIENAILYLLGIQMPTGIEQTEWTNQQSVYKFIHTGQLFIRVDSRLFDTCGRPVSNQ